MRKSKQTKRSGGYVRRFESMLSSPAYRDLRPTARCLLEEFQRVYRPGRNGHLSVTLRAAAGLIRVSEPTASNAFHELEGHGFLVLTSSHMWRERMAREWRLTFESHNGRQPTDDWKMWEQPESSPKN